MVELEGGASAACAPPQGDGAVLEALRRGDEGAFADLVERLTPAMLRLAAAYVPNRAVAEEVVQDTWLAVVRGLGAFEGRSSLRTWVYRILLNRARSTGDRERRSVVAELGDDPPPERGRFAPSGAWSVPPTGWDEQPEDRLLAAETLGVVERAIAGLPFRQRLVVDLRDRQHLSAAEVGELLDLSDGNQRVLLHRGRRVVRAALEEDLR